MHVQCVYAGYELHVSLYLVDVPFRTSHILHLNASALFLKVQTLQSQNPLSAEGLACLFGLQDLKRKWLRHLNSTLHPN